MSAGRLVLLMMAFLRLYGPYSGHYLPTEDKFNSFINFLRENHVDLSNVKRCSIDDDDLSYVKVYDVESKSEITTPIMTKDDVKSIWLVIDALDDMTSTDTRNINTRIGCLRDCPMELQSQALGLVKLCPTLHPLPCYSKNDSPIPSPRPVPKVRISTRLACMVIPIPMISPSASIAS